MKIVAVQWWPFAVAWLVPATKKCDRLAFLDGWGQADVLQNSSHKENKTFHYLSLRTQAATATIPLHSLRCLIVQLLPLGRPVFKEKNSLKSAKGSGRRKNVFCMLQGEVSVWAVPESQEMQEIRMRQHSESTFLSRRFFHQNLAQLTATANPMLFCNAEGPFQVTELQLASFSGKKSSFLRLCNTTRTNASVSKSLANRVSFHGTALKLMVNGIKTLDVIDTK